MPIDKNTNDDILELGLTSLLLSNRKITLKEHLKSFVITFVAGFAMVLVADIDNVSLETIKDGSSIGLLFGAIRAGVKAVLQLVITRFSSI